MDDQVEGNLLFTPENKQLLCGLFRPLLLENYNPEALVEATRALGNITRHADARGILVQLRVDEVVPKPRFRQIGPTHCA